MAFMRLDDDEIVERLLANQALLRLPLLRAGGRLSVGIDEQAWRGWLSKAGAAGQ